MGTSLRELVPQGEPIARQFLGWCAKHLGPYRINSVRRSMTEQQDLYANFLKCGCSSCPPRPGRCFPVAKPGGSPHALGIAFDARIEGGPMVNFNGKRMPRNQVIAGLVWERLGFRWGGRFSQPDEIHFDFHPRGWTP